MPQAGATSTETTLAAVATAVLSTLYGALTAHLVCIPIGRAIDRKGEREDIEREELFELLFEELDIDLTAEGEAA